MADTRRPFARHQLVWVDPAGWRAMLNARDDLLLTPVLDIWAENGWPLIVRRPACGDVPGEVPLGLPLPPHLGKHRVRITMPAEAIRRSAPPPLLADAAAAAPIAWRATIAALVEADRSVRCYGSLAWQYLTRLAYVADASDLDLLWGPGSASDAAALALRIAGIEARAPMRIDGEFVAPSGLAVQWREWHSAAPELVSKAQDDVRLVAREQVFA